MIDEPIEQRAGKTVRGLARQGRQVVDVQYLAPCQKFGAPETCHALDHGAMPEREYLIGLCLLAPHLRQKKDKSLLVMLAENFRNVPQYVVFGALTGGARAEGGPVQAGKTYLVGENGPEILQFGASGFITPNDRIPTGTATPTTGRSGNAPTIEIQAGVVTDQRALGSIIVDAIAEYERANGAGWRG